jgi:signal transduction histidine kinase
MSAQHISWTLEEGSQESDRPGQPLITSGVVPAVIGLMLTVMLMLLDFSTWIELNVAVAYSLPLVFAAASRKPRVLWALAAVLIVATFVVYQVQIPSARVQPPAGGGWASMQDPYLVDRALAALTILLTATILQGWLYSIRAIEARDRLIEDSNLRLAKANKELMRHKAEITAQNAELERRRREAEAISSRKTQMLASISHDIRTPIQAISLMAEIMRRTANAPAPEARLPDYAQRLQAHALSVAELLAEVMDFASFDAGEVPLHISEFPVQDLLAEQVQRLAPLAENKGLDLRLGPSGDSLLLRTDKVKVGRVIGNLVSNAVKFTAQGSVTLDSSIDGDNRVCIRVVDTGCGIRPHDLQRIFGDFCQAEDAGVQSGSGWGLGLSIARRLTIALGGELLVESQFGRGSTFTVVLPGTVLTSSSDRPAT